MAATAGGRGKPKPGDVFEVTLRDHRLAYLQMVSETETAEVVRVLAGRYESTPGDLAALVARPHDFLMFVALRILAGDGYAKRVGNWPTPAGAWSGLRLSARTDRSGKVEGWVVTDGRYARQRFEELPAAVRKELPIWQICPSSDVVDIILASRAGGMESRELQAWREANGLRAADGVLDSDDQPGVRHFAVFREGVNLDTVMAELKDLGFSCTIFADPDLDGQLLVIKAEESAPGFVDDQWDRVESVVMRAGGEYDGWEASTGKPQQ